MEALFCVIKSLFMHSNGLIDKDYCNLSLFCSNHPFSCNVCGTYFSFLTHKEHLSDYILNVFLDIQYISINYIKLKPALNNKPSYLGEVFYFLERTKCACLICQWRGTADDWINDSRPLS